ncbi:MAG: divergent polysaccharide deacetylase family protein [Proteobacteria bacterium]|nr:divergent polysaccharide deacetylase family protein [Pseudomonadota bacterium]
MKIPKLPKLPKLPKFAKLPKIAALAKIPGLQKLFKKKDSDDEADDEFGLDPEVTGGDSLPVAGDADVDFRDDDFDEEEDAKERRKPLMIAAAGAFVLLTGVAGGAGWWYFSGDEEASKPATQSAGKSRDSAKGPMVQMALPPKPGAAKQRDALNTFSGATNRGLSPPQGKDKGIEKPASKTTISAVADTSTGKKKSLARVAGDIGGQFGGKANPLGGSLNAIGGAVQDKASGIVLPAVTSVTLRNLPDYPSAKPLGATPDVRLIEKKEGLTGTLPIIGKDGEAPWKIYARPYAEDEDAGMRVAIVITGVGLSRAASMAAIGKLPPQVTLALDPYATDLSDWLVRARLVGHEVMLSLPMESERFPIHDAGPYALDTGLNEQDNIKRLELVLSQVSGYFGVATTMGSRFGTSEALLTSVLGALKKRGLFFLTTGVQGSLLAPKIAKKIDLPRAVSDLTLDDDPSRTAIDIKLLRLESILKERKIAVAVGQAYPATLERLIAWTKKLEEKKITLVPLSALANMQDKQDKP